MIDTERFFLTARRSGIEFFTGVPDSLLKEFCAFAADRLPVENHVIAPNEGGAMGLAMGYGLSSGKVPLVYLQNSGLGNLVNPVLSLAAGPVYAIPALLLIGWRGEPGVADEPQHRVQGEATLGMLEVMDIPSRVLPVDTAEACTTLTEAHEQAIRESRPVALVAKKGCFSGYSRPADVAYPNAVSRIDAMSSIVEAMPPDTAFVATTGFTSRELFTLREATGSRHDGDFLTIGGMGHASSIAAGLALGGWRGITCCLDGDGAFLMHMGSSTTVAANDSASFLHVVFNNGMHESVGGQPTIAPTIDMVGVARSVGYRLSERFDEAEALRSFLHTAELRRGPIFLEIRCAPSNLPGLRRPSRTPERMKADFMAFLAQD